MNKTTIKDVAHYAGVSIATVSRVISNSPKVKKDYASRVREAIKALNYTPNIVAQNVKGSLKNIGVILNPESNDAFLTPYIAEILRGIAQTTQDAGYFVQLLSFDRKDRYAQDLVDFYYGKRIDGYILLSSFQDDPFIKKFSECGVKFVVYGLVDDENLANKVYTVDTPNRSDVATSISYLIKLGHKHIAMVNSSEHYTVNRERRLGYEDALTMAGITINQSIIIQTTEDIEQTRDAIRKLLLSNPYISAVFCKNDLKARLVIDIAEELGLKVPDNLSVIGHNNDIYLSDFSKPALTTVHVPAHDIGSCLGKNILAQIKNQPNIIRREILPTNLIIRNSCTRV